MTRIDRVLARLDRLQAELHRRSALRALAQRLVAAGVDPRLAEAAARKAERCGCPLCEATTRKGLPCLALGTGKGGRCRFHGGASTGPKSAGGRARALAALARGREVAAANRRAKAAAKAGRAAG